VTIASVVLNGVPLTSYVDAYTTETWLVENQDLSTQYQWECNTTWIVTFCAIAPAGQYYNPYGQVAFDSVSLTTELCDDVVLTANILEDVICVEPSPNLVEFGDIYRGQCKEVMSALTITNCGNVDATVTALVGGELYIGNLQISSGEGWVDWDDWSTSLNASASKVIHLKICVPSDYSGLADGTLKFIAQEQIVP